MKDKSVVTIRPLAYYKMLLHVLRFGSKVMNRNKFNEVMGVLIGHLEGEEEIKNVIVEDAIPVSHGGSIEVEFSSEQLGAFGQLDNEIWENYGDLGWFSVGWYHSHPGLSIFFSGTDVKNQMFWQDRNPSGIGIVFDHNYLEIDNDFRKAHNIKKMLNPGEIDYGFRTFRLQDPSSITSKWYEVETIVELPDSLEFYIKLIEIIEKIHAKESLILEINETPDIFNNVNIPYPDQLMINRYDMNIDKLLNSFKDSASEFIVSTFNPLFSFFNHWSQELVSKILTNNTQIRDSLISLKQILSSNISKIQRNFKSSLSYKLDETNDYIFDRIERFDKEFENINVNLKNFKQELEDDVKKIFNQELKPSLDLINNSMSENVSLLNQNSEIQREQKIKIEDLYSEIEQVLQKINLEKNNIIDNINGASEKINILLTEKLNSSSANINNIMNQLNESSSNVDNITSTIKSSNKLIPNLKEKVKDLNSKNESLENKIKVLKSTNPELLGKIDNLAILEKERNTYENKINDLSFKQTKIEQEVRNLEQEREGLEKELNDTKTKKEALEHQINELEGKNAQLQEKCNELESENNELKEKVHITEEDSQEGKKKKKDKKKSRGK